MSEIPGFPSAAEGDGLLEAAAEGDGLLDAPLPFVAKTAITVATIVATAPMTAAIIVSQDLIVRERRFGLLLPPPSPVPFPCLGPLVAVMHLSWLLANSYPPVPGTRYTMTKESLATIATREGKVTLHPRYQDRFGELHLFVLC